MLDLSSITSFAAGSSTKSHSHRGLRAASQQPPQTASQPTAARLRRHRASSASTGSTSESLRTPLPGLRIPKPSMPQAAARSSSRTAPAPAPASRQRASSNPHSNFVPPVGLVSKAPTPSTPGRVPTGGNLSCRMTSRAVLALSDVVASSSGITVAIALAEKAVHLQGFSRNEQQERPPAMLRGSLVLKVTKATKIKAVTLRFQSSSRTDWPEGIPTKKVNTHETMQLLWHEWKFFDATQPQAIQSSGAHLVQPADCTPLVRTNTREAAQAAASLMAEGDGLVVPATPIAAQTLLPRTGHGTAALVVEEAAAQQNKPAAPAEGPLASNSAAAMFAGLAAAPNANISATAPAANAPSERGRPLTRDRMMVAEPRCRRSSPSPAQILQPDAASKGFRIFQPAEYIYNFEFPIPHTTPETLQSNFGHVRHWLEASVDRAGAFKHSLSGSRDVTVLRALAMSNLEVSEPIVISRDWDNLLHYEVVIAGKAFAIGASIPIAFALVPLDKVKCHRIRIYLTEHIQYYARKGKVHRVEPTHKFLLLEKVPDDGPTGSLIHWDADTEVSGSEFEFNVKIPSKFYDRRDKLRPNFNSPQITVHHWIKIVMRISRQNPANPRKIKTYEVSIDSPVTLVDSHTVVDFQLPAYSAAGAANTDAFAFHALQEVVGSTTAAAASLRPGMPSRQPSIDPPPFDEDLRGPPLYDEHDSLQSYRQRFANYERSHTGPDDDDMTQPETETTHSDSSAQTSESSSMLTLSQQQSAPVSETPTSTTIAPPLESSTEAMASIHSNSPQSTTPPGSHTPAAPGSGDGPSRTDGCERECALEYEHVSEIYWHEDSLEISPSSSRVVSPRLVPVEDPADVAAATQQSNSTETNTLPCDDQDSIDPLSLPAANPQPTSSLTSSHASAARVAAADVTCRQPPSRVASQLDGEEEVVSYASPMSMRGSRSAGAVAVAAADTNATTFGTLLSAGASARSSHSTCGRYFRQASVVSVSEQSGARSSSSLVNAATARAADGSLGDDGIRGWSSRLSEASEIPPEGFYRLRSRTGSELSVAISVNEYNRGRLPLLDANDDDLDGLDVATDYEDDNSSLYRTFSHYAIHP